MSGLGIFALIVGGIILAINFVIHFSNLVKIIRYTFATNSLGNYWKYFFKGNFSARALISSLIALVFASIIFLLIAPFVLVRKYMFKDDEVS
jgi:hypothetical protein